VFVDRSAFGPGEVESILQAGLDHDLAAKLHADQLSNTGGAALAASLRAASADHLDCISDEGIKTLADSQTVAVTLPLAGLYLDPPPMPARKLIEASVPVEVATDFNPGAAPSFHLPLAMLLACTRERMTADEALKGTTLSAARAIDEEDSVGLLEPGKRADFAIIDASDATHWIYNFAANKCLANYIVGRQVF
jgi:imidazolonepropionase